MLAAAIVVLQNVTTPPGARSLLERLASTEGRYAVTVVIVVLALLFALVIAPLAIRRLRGAVGRRVPAGRFPRAFDRASDGVLTTFSGVLLRSTQVAVLLAASLALLVVWGLVDLAAEVLAVIGLSLPLATRIATTLGLAVVAYVAVDIFRQSVGQFARRSDRVTEHQQEIMLRVGNLAIVALAVTTALTLWGIDLSGLLVGAGFLGIVVGLAARQTLGSLIAGLVLMFSRPFTIGDWVEIGDEEGVVTEITVINTRLENFDGETVVIPNDRVANQSITNRSERGHLRVRLDVNIDYESDPEHAADVARAAMEEVKSVTDSPPPQVVRKSFGDSAMVLELRFWIDRPMPPRKWGAVDAVVQGVKESFEAEGVKIPFPQRELSGRAETGGFRLADDGVEGPRADERHGERSPDPSSDG